MVRDGPLTAAALLSGLLIDGFDQYPMFSTAALMWEAIADGAPV